MREVRFVCGDEATEWIPAHERLRVQEMHDAMQIWADFIGEVVEMEERFKS